MAGSDGSGNLYCTIIGCPCDCGQQRIPDMKGYRHAPFFCNVYGIIVRGILYGGDDSFKPLENTGIGNVEQVDSFLKHSDWEIIARNPLLFELVKNMLANRRKIEIYYNSETT